MYRWDGYKGGYLKISLDKGLPLREEPPGIMLWEKSHSFFNSHKETEEEITIIITLSCFYGHRNAFKT